MDPTNRSYDGWIGRTAYDNTDQKIGEIDEIFYDDATGRPEWVAIKTGLFGAKQTFVPIHGSQPCGDDDGDMRVAYDKETIKSAPSIDPDGHMDPDEERELWRYYGYDYTSKDYGIGTGQTRADKDFAYRRYDAQRNDWDPRERRLEDHTTEEVPVSTTATVEVPVQANVRLRRYQTQNRKTETRTVEVPVTETEEHVEVAGVDAKAQRPMQQQPGRTKR